MSDLTDSVSAIVPPVVRRHLGRAAVQTIANRAQVRLIHIKGDTIATTIHPNASPGSDVDVMVHPDGVSTLDASLHASGWRVYSTFAEGSPFGHAQTYLHEIWGYLDVHRCFPGIGLDSEPAFERLWAMRHAITVAGVTCQVPCTTAQAVILILNSVRARRPIAITSTWNDAPAELRVEMEAEVDALNARLAFDAAFGRLEDHRNAREYRLWKAVIEGGGRVDEWLGRLHAAPTLRARIGVVLRAPLVNRSHLEHRIGRRPTRFDVFREFFDRPLRGLRELMRRRRP